MTRAPERVQVVEWREAGASMWRTSERSEPVITVEIRALYPPDLGNAAVARAIVDTAQAVVLRLLPTPGP